MFLRDLAKLGPDQKQSAISEMVAKAQGPDRGQLDGVRQEIRTLEAKYGISTEQMRAAFKDGTLPDEYETARWLMLARMVR